MLNIRRVLAVVLSSTLLVACNNSGPLGGGSAKSEGRVFQIEPGPNATRDMIAASVSVAPKDVIQFGCGFFDLSSGLLLQNTEQITVRGCGKDKTVLSFRGSESPEGVLAINVRGLVVEELTVLDSPGDAIKLKGVDHGTLRRVRTIWSSARLMPNEDTITAENFPQKLNVACTNPPRFEGAPTPDYTPSRRTGRYGIYPVESDNILVDESESVGASDAGIYVGQTNNAIIKRSRAAYNVMGFEIENVQGGEYDSNLAECNTGGFLIYDLDALTQYGERSRMFNNISRNNNSYNFNSGGFVGNVPRGSGFITLAYDKIEAFNNQFLDNDTAGMIITSYKLVDPGLADKKIDGYTEGIHIHNNVFRNNGGRLPPPDLGTILRSGGSEVASALPMLIGLKNVAGLLGGAPGFYQGAHIAWDGLRDERDEGCPYPVDQNGEPVPQWPSGKPMHTNEHPNPSCHYNAYKFDAEGVRKEPEWSMCIHDNDFSADSTKYMNFHGQQGLEVLDLLGDLSGDALIAVVRGLPGLVADKDIEVHNCQARFGKVLEPLAPVVIPPFTPSGTASPAPTDAEIARVCDAAPRGNAINSGALGVNCPRLDQYHLFADPEDPRSTPNGSGVPYTLNSKLFTDYATKYRVVFLPPGEKATYKSAAVDGPNAAIHFPVGTVIAKTFAFTDETAGTETPVETRLLIKRQGSNGQVRWDGLPYIWETGADGKRVAKLALGGGQASVKWDFHDVDSGVQHKGSTTSYQIPHANQCITCHANDDAEPGSAPIGPKVRHLNRPYRSDSPMPSGQAIHPVSGANQIDYWCRNGLLANCPTDLGIDATTLYATKLERVPVFNKPGDSGKAANSKEDVEARVRAYLEINCAHCHNPRGAASNTGLYLDSLRKVNTNYGICKGVTAAGGEGTGGRDYDIHPGTPENSVIPFRMGTNDVTARMPPIARSVTHDEAVALVEQWIDTVVDSSYEGADACRGGGGLFGR